MYKYTEANKRNLLSRLGDGVRDRKPSQVKTVEKVG